MSTLFGILTRTTPAVATALHAATSTETSADATVRAGFNFQPDGTVDDWAGGVNNQIFPNTDWIRPTDYANKALFNIKCVNLSGSGLQTENPTCDSGSALLSSTRSYLYARTTVGSSDCTLDIELRDENSVLVATATYTIHAQKTA
jgi:hypothetical protein